jgi:hypothetical protein
VTPIARAGVGFTGQSATHPEDEGELMRIHRGHDRPALLAAVLLLVLSPAAQMPRVSSGAVVFTEDFEVNNAANWTVNSGPSDAAVDFSFDYSTVGIPAPFAFTGTRGLKLQANQVNGIFSGVSVSPNGQSFAGDFRMHFSWWANFNGPFPAGGSGSTQLSTFGIGTSGTVAQWAGGTQDSIWFGATGDGNSSSDYRAYSPTAPGRYADTAPGIYAAGAVAGSSNADHALYSFNGDRIAPPEQTALFPQQTGITMTGAAGMEWHFVEIQRIEGFVKWSIDAAHIATVPVGDDAFPGENIFFGHSDINATSSTDPNDSALLFTLIDNVFIHVVPEPSSLGLLLAPAGVALLRRRRGGGATSRRAS